MVIHRFVVVGMRSAHGEGLFLFAPHLLARLLLGLQTLFFVERDGVLSGASWPQSRNVLLVTCGAAREQADLVQLFVAPEVRQRLPGWRWVRTESGLWQTPKRGGRLFDAAGFATTLAPGEFAVLAPSAQAEVYGLIGGALLIREEDGRRYDSYVFLRPELSHVDQPG